MEWRDFQVGMFVSGEAEDFFQILEGSRDEAEATEYPFRFEGRIESITQRKVVIDGWWHWLCDEDDCTPDDPVESRGRFGIIRGGILFMTVLAKGGTWVCPQ